MDAWELALNSRDDLAKYGDNDLLLFALELNQEIDDIELIANDALTDGPDDKKSDLIYVNRETGKVIIAQAYKKNGKTDCTAPSNKASDLNTAATWIFQSTTTSIPEIIRAAAEQVHLALNDDQITSVEFWYVHNCNESSNVQNELHRVASTADSLIKRFFPSAEVDSVHSIEVGKSILEEWYRATQAPILVGDTFEFVTRGGFSSAGKNWTAYSTSVSAQWLHQMFREHGKSLFSANVRDYLGSRRSDKNINHNIKQTASSRPDMFWVFNNGITALVNDFESISEDDFGLFKISGIAIVNGAQTTGALGSLDEIDLSNAYVPARFVKCSDQSTITDIIRFNNSQNKIEPADFRSNDAIQSRLRNEFTEIPEVEYFGGRRGGSDDVMRRSRNIISSYSVGQALMAFHGDPGTAYNQRSQIWQSDALYSHIFNDYLTAVHALCAYSLLKAVDAAKANLKAIPDDQRTGPQTRYNEILRQRGATFLLTSAIASGLETILSRPINSKFKVHFSKNISVREAIIAWQPVVDVVMPCVAQLSGAFSGGNIANKENVKSAIIIFVDMLEATKVANNQIFTTLSEKICLD
ncbi:AIPR family protein [Methylophaga sp.]|uniref:AIPR family protein n=1 Tax=Methylophaga sp. TaxID=2024840 RepID=UPI003A8F430B